MEVTGVWASEVEEIRQASIVEGEVDGSGNLVLTNGAGASFNAGKVTAPLAAWPIGSIYMNFNSTSPADLFGGTWSRFGQGKMLISQDPTDASFDTAGETGGSKTHTNTTIEMAAHDHGGSTGGQSNTHQHPIGTGDLYYVQGSTGPNTILSLGTPVETGDADQDHHHGVNSQGDGQAYSIMNPYIVVYMWRRTA